MKLINGYLTLHCYLEGIYHRTESDSIGAMLGGMIICPDGSTADPAYEHDWDSAAEIAASEAGSSAVETDLCLRAACLFLGNWLSDGYDPHIGAAYDDLVNDAGRVQWITAAEKVKNGQYRL